MQLNGDLAQKFATIQEKLHVTLGDAELSAKKVQESSLKESSLNAQIEDLNLQLKKDLDSCARIETLEQENEKLEQTLKTSITTEEHQVTICIRNLTSNNNTYLSTDVGRKPCFDGLLL